MSLFGRAISSGEEDQDRRDADREADPIDRDQLQVSAGLAYQLGSAVLALRGSFNKVEGDSDTYAVGPSFRMPLNLFRQVRTELAADATFTDDEDIFLVRLVVQANRGRYGLSGSLGGAHVRGSDDEEENGTRPVASAALTWRDEELHPAEIEATLRADSDPLGDRSVGAGGSIASAYGSLQAFVDRDLGEDGSTPYFLTARTSLIVDERGGFSFGGARPGPAALALDLAGDLPASFDVLADDGVVAVVPPGRRTPVPLPAYRGYDIRIRPTASGFADYDSRARRVTLYPGNAVRLDYEVRRLVAVFGQLVDGTGAPLRNRRITGGVDPAFTDTNGFFLVEVTDKAPRFAVATEAGECPVDLAAQIAAEPEADFVDLGSVACP